MYLYIEQPIGTVFMSKDDPTDDDIKRSNEGKLDIYDCVTKVKHLHGKDWRPIPKSEVFNNGEMEFHIPSPFVPTNINRCRDRAGGMQWDRP